MSLVKRYTVDRYERATSSSPTTGTAGTMRIKVERCSSGGGNSSQLDGNIEFPMATNDVVDSKIEFAADRLSPADAKIDDHFQCKIPGALVVDLTASGSSVLGTVHEDGYSCGQTNSLLLPDRRQPVLPLTKGAGGAAVPEPATARSKCARNAEVIKARYIRSVQQYRKVCSLIDLLAAQHAKLQARRRQLQRTMCSLSSMYRLNKARVLNAGPNGSTIPADVNVGGSRAQFPLAAVDDVTFYRQSPPLSLVDYRHGSTMAVPISDNVAMLSPDEEFGSEEAMITATENVIRADAVNADDPKRIRMASSSPPNLRHGCRTSPHMPTTTPPHPLPVSRQHATRSPIITTTASSSMEVRWKREAGYEAKPEVRDFGGLCQQPMPRPGAPFRQNNPYPVATVAAHCKSNSIDIPVPDYERPVAAHTLKADLSCYSYMQLCRH